MTSPAQPTMYQRIGGQHAVHRMVEHMYHGITQDDELWPFFAGQDMFRIKGHMRALLTSVLGGKAEYRGREIGEAHKDLRITPRDFALVADHVEAAMKTLHVPADIYGYVMSTLSSLAPVVVTAPDR